MLLHIVRSGETIRVIADNYQCEVSDITSNNLHITDFKNLKAGMKLKIPFLSKNVIDTLEETESFVKDYYPNLKENFDSKAKVEKEVKVDDVIINNEETIEKKPASKPSNTPSPIYQRYGYYSGNIVPEIPDKHIKKI